MSGVGLLISLVVAIIVIIVAISKWKIHPFLALMGVSLILAIVVGIPLQTIPNMIGSGFSGTFTSIGIVIILGALIGSILEKTGGAVKLAEVVVKIVGKNILISRWKSWAGSYPFQYSVIPDSLFLILSEAHFRKRQVIHQ